MHRVAPGFPLLAEMLLDSLKRPARKLYFPTACQGSLHLVKDEIQNPYHSAPREAPLLKLFHQVVRERYVNRGS